ncbi:MAG: MOSC domain-containing protein [Planctomycetota bacterium]
MSNRATVAGIYITPTAGAVMQSVDSIMAITDKGLEGDRYAAGAGYYSKIEGWGAQVTLIQSEAIDAVNTGHDAEYTPEMLRRNIVTSGLKLKDLIGCEFTCGEAVLRGIKLFPPCMRLAQLCKKREVLQYFSHCGGIGAEVVCGGEIALSDEVELTQI